MRWIKVYDYQYEINIKKNNLIELMAFITKEVYGKENSWQGSIEINGQNWRFSKYTSKEKAINWTEQELVKLGKKLEKLAQQCYYDQGV